MYEDVDDDDLHGGDDDSSGRSRWCVCLIRNVEDD